MTSLHSLRRNRKKWPCCKKRSRKPIQLLYSTSYLGPKSTLWALAWLWVLHLDIVTDPFGKKVSSRVGILLPIRKVVTKWVLIPEPLNSLLILAWLGLMQKEIHKHETWLENVFILHRWEYITRMLWSLPSHLIFHHLKSKGYLTGNALVQSLLLKLYFGKWAEHINKQRPISEYNPINN